MSYPDIPFLLDCINGTPPTTEQLMKRKTRSMADVDTNGRVRRTPNEDKPDLVTARIMDGPGGQHEMQVPRGADTVRVGPLTYSYAGKDGRVPLYCMRPNQRAIRRVIGRYVAATGTDPRVRRALDLKTPAKAGPSKRGQGKSRRPRGTWAQQAVARADA